MDSSLQKTSGHHWSVFWSAFYSCLPFLCGNGFFRNHRSHNIPTCKRQCMIYGWIRLFSEINISLEMSGAMRRCGLLRNMLRILLLTRKIVIGRSSSSWHSFAGFFKLKKLDHCWFGGAKLLDEFLVHLFLWPFRIIFHCLYLEHLCYRSRIFAII